MPSGDTPQGFTGTISLRLTDLIQMVCLSRSDLVIGVTSQKGHGKITIKQGRIQHAQSDGLIGEEAFLEVLRWNDGQFEILPASDSEEESVHKPWEHLLLEAIRGQDEEISSGNPDTEDLFGEIDSLLGAQIPGGEACPVPEEAARIEEPRAPVRILVVDDSAFFTKRLKAMLEADRDIEVVGIARNGTEALQVLESGIAVDLVTLDVEMPVMPGDTTLKHIMIRHHVPVLIISSIQPESMGKILDFLQLGAVEFFSKPAARDDLESVGDRLRTLARGVASARVGNFRRLRKRSEPALLPPCPDLAGDPKLLVVVGAEGAHMDWFRFPLRDLCREWIVLGLQKLGTDFVPAFARIIESRTGASTRVLSAKHRMKPGCLYFGNACRDAEFRFAGGECAMEARILDSDALSWKAGVQMWLNRLAEQRHERMVVYFSSAVEALPDSFVANLLACGSCLILAPSESVLCGQLVDGIRPYSDLFPGQIRYSSPERLPEVLKQ